MTTEGESATPTTETEVISQDKGKNPEEESGVDRAARARERARQRMAERKLRATTGGGASTTAPSGATSGEVDAEAAAKAAAETAQKAKEMEEDLSDGEQTLREARELLAKFRAGGGKAARQWGGWRKKSKPPATTGGRDVEAQVPADGGQQQQPEAPEKRDADVEEKAPLTALELGAFVENAATMAEKRKAWLWKVSAAPADPRAEPGSARKEAAESGLYVGQGLNQTRFNSSSWRARLQKQATEGDPGWNIAESCESRPWLTQDGSVFTLPDALKVLHERPEFLTFEQPEEGAQCEFMPPVIVVPSSAARDTGGAFYQLEVTVAGLSLHDHPLFCEEDVLATQLGILIKTYRIRQEASLPEFYRDKFLMVMAKSEKQPQKATSGIRDQIFKLCDIWREEEHLDKQLLKRIAGIWRRLATLRQEQGFSSTRMKLGLKLLPRDVEMEEVLADRDTEHELVRIEFQHEQRERRKKGLPGETPRDQSAPAPAPGDARDGEERGGDGGNKGKQKQADMKEDEVFDREMVRQELRREIVKKKYSSGVNRYQAKLSFRNAITPTESCPPGEQQRRRLVEGSRFSIELVINNKRATRTTEQPLSFTTRPDDPSSMSVVFSEIFPVQVARWPESLALAVISIEGGKETTIAQIPIAVPVLETASSPSPRQFFSNGFKWRPTWERSTAAPEHCFTGTISCCAQWSRDPEDGTLLAPPVSMKARQQASVLAPPTEEAESCARLREWLRAAPDPNDPTRSVKGETFSVRGATSFSFYDPLRLGGGEASPKRHKLLRMRRDGVYSSAVPLLETEIDDELVDQKKLGGSAETRAEEDDSLEDERSRALATLADRMTDDFLVSFTERKRPKMCDVVTTERLALFDWHWLSFAWPKPERPLKPERMEKQPIPITQLSTPVRVVVQILHATGVPARKGHGTGAAPAQAEPGRLAATLPASGGQFAETTLAAASTSAAGMAVGPAPAATFPPQPQPDLEDAQEPRAGVMPFVQITLRGKSAAERPARTRASPGEAPLWNESLSLTMLAAPPENLSSKGEQAFDTVFGSGIDQDVTLHVSLLDEADDTTGGKPRFIAEEAIHLRNLLWHSSRFEGFLKLREPLASTSHQHAYSGSVQQQVRSTDVELSLYVTLDPPLAPPSTVDEHPTRQTVHLFETKETGDQVLSWCKELQGKIEGRRFSEPYALTLTRRAVLLPQLIRQLEPPPGLATWKQFARFVSLIPPRMEPISLSLRRVSVVATAQEVLDMRRAGGLERAVLLCSLLHNDTTISASYVLLGTAQGEGAVAVVLVVTKGGDQLVIVPGSGQWYSLRSPPPHSHIIDIDMAFDRTNIWANLQPMSAASRNIAVDFTVAKAWLPFFSARIPARDLPPFQPTMTYAPTDTKFVKAVQREVEKKVTEAIERWRRPRLPTHWNRVCSRALAELLATCEDAAIDIGPGTPVSDSSAHESALDRWRSSYPHIEACALGFTHGGTDDILGRIERTNMHTCQDRKAEFALAIHVNPYPNKIFAVWVYIAVLH